MPINIEKMTPKDIDRVWEIDKAAFPLPWSRNMYEREFQHGLSYYFVAREDGEIVGFGGFWKIEQEAHLTNFGVHPNYQHKGIGRQLLKELLELAVSLGCRRATLEVRVSNERARQFYEKAGFDMIAIRKKYYPDNQEDALVYWNNGLK